MRTLWAGAVLVLIAFSCSTLDWQRLSARRDDAPAQALARLEAIRDSLRRGVVRDTAALRRAEAEYARERRLYGSWCGTPTAHLEVRCGLLRQRLREGRAVLARVEQHIADVKAVREEQARADAALKPAGGIASPAL